MRVSPCAICNEPDPCMCTWEARELRGIRARLLRILFWLVSKICRGASWIAITCWEDCWATEHVAVPLLNLADKLRFSAVKLAIRWRPRLSPEQAFEELLRHLAATVRCGCGESALGRHRADCRWYAISDGLKQVQFELGLTDIADTGPLLPD